jgi:hypothetical protein
METIRQLNASELDRVAGGAAGETPEQEASRLYQERASKLRPEHLLPVRVPPPSGPVT